jgi:hypothetical protein
MTEAVLLYYDYLLTLSDEVDRFWHRGPHSWASIIFFANRYIALLGHLPFVWSVYADPCKVGVGPIAGLLSDDDLFSCFQEHVSLVLCHHWAGRHASLD